MKRSASLLLLCIAFAFNSFSAEPFPSSVPNEILIQFKGIKQLLKQADDAYHKEHRSVMSDEAYDYLRSYHDQLIDEFPGLEDLEASVFVDDVKRQKVAHEKPVLSLKKSYSDETIKTFCKSVGHGQTFLLEPKIDGASIIIEYKNGRLVKALTRGNSLKGVDITNALLASNALPLVIETPNTPEDLNLRGEAYLSNKTFNRLNEERIAQNNKPFSTARNTASGTLMLKDFKEIQNRHLQVLIFEVRNAMELGIHSDLEALQLAKALGLPVVDVSKASSTDELLSLIRDKNQQRQKLPFATDGFVIKVDDLLLREKLGSTKKYPRWAIARKFRSEPVITTVLAIEYSISEKGKKTPIAVLEPVQIQGATVKRATLHSESIVKSMGIKVGSKVKVIRAGGVVPEIVGVIETELPPHPHSLPQ